MIANIKCLICDQTYQYTSAKWQRWGKKWCQSIIFLINIAFRRRMAQPGSVGFLMPSTKSNIRYRNYLVIVNPDNCLPYRNRGPMLRGSQLASGSTTHNTVTTQSFRWENVNSITKQHWKYFIDPALGEHLIMFVYFSTLKSPSEMVWYIVTKTRVKWRTRTQRRPRGGNRRMD